MTDFFFSEFCTGAEAVRCEGDALNGDDLESLCDRLSPFRAEKVKGCKRAEKRRQALYGGLLLESKLEELFGIKMGNAEYTLNEHGKPFLAGEDGERIKFNLSHSDGMVMLAVSDECDLLGCDVERIRDVDLKMAERFFTKTESEYVRYQTMLGEKAGRRAFFRLWTLKESFVKAVGCGLTVPLKSFEIYFDENDTPHVTQTAVNADFVFKESLHGECDGLDEAFASAAAIGYFVDN